MDKIKKRYTWESPWGYKESFLIGLGLVYVGLALEYVTGYDFLSKIQAPYNVYICMAYTVIIILTYIYCRQTTFVKWLVGVPMAVSSFVFIILIVAVMGVIPQDLNYGGWIISKFGLNRVSTNVLFLFMMFYFLTPLGFVTIKKIHNIYIGVSSLNIRNVGFILTHFGLWLTLLTAIFGANDIQHLKIKLGKGDKYNIATTTTGEDYPLSFYIKLSDFTVKEFSPKLAIIDNKTGNIISSKKNSLVEISKPLSFTFDNYTIEVEEYLVNSAPIGNRYVEVLQQGTLHSAKIKIVNIAGGEEIEAWVSSGNYMYQYQSIKINDKYSLLMTLPEVKHFESKIDIYSRNNELLKKDISIELNNPYDYMGYKIYQLGYDEKKGKWSDYSILELVRDPWINTVYIGIYMLMLGLIIILVKGKEKI